MQLSTANKHGLEKKAAELRRTLLEMLYGAGSGHPGGSLSVVEILTYLYYHEMAVNPEYPRDPNRDRLILSKGHACPILYAILADKGFFSLDTLRTFRQFHSILQGHPDMNKVPGIDISSGSLGMGLSFGVGTALGGLLNKANYHTYVITGDGELDEGQNWEAMMCAAKYKLDNLTLIVDHNKVQLDGSTDEIMPLGDVVMKITSFGWNVIECDGHDFESISHALNETHVYKGRPSAVVAHTVKGKGISFMEGNSSWHGKKVDRASFEMAMAELGG